MLVFGDVTQVLKSEIKLLFSTDRYIYFSKITCISVLNEIYDSSDHSASLNETHYINTQEVNIWKSLLHMASGKYYCGEECSPPLPHQVSHNIGLTPFTNLSSGREDNWKVTYPVDGGSSLLWSFDADLPHHILGDCRISNDHRQNLKPHFLSHCVTPSIKIVGWWVRAERALVT